MSQLIQETKYITVQDFLPKWTKFAETHHSLMRLHQTQNQFGLDISDLSYCLVGEAHGLSRVYSLDKYGCGFCMAFSSGDLKINGITYQSAMYNLENFYNFKEGLYKHFQRFHKEKLIINEEMKIE